MPCKQSRDCSLALPDRDGCKLLRSVAGGTQDQLSSGCSPCRKQHAQPLSACTLQGVRKISFKQFRKALELLAAEKGVAKGELWQKNAIWVSLVALWSLPPLLPLLARSPNQRCSVVSGFPPFPPQFACRGLVCSGGGLRRPHAQLHHNSRGSGP